MARSACRHHASLLSQPTAGSVVAAAQAHLGGAEGEGLFNGTVLQVMLKKLLVLFYSAKKELKL